MYEPLWSNIRREEQAIVTGRLNEKIYVSYCFLRVKIYTRYMFWLLYSSPGMAG